MEQIVARTIAPWRFSTIVFTAFSLLALLFAANGLSALIAYGVKQRAREIGIRLALGARRARSSRCSYVKERRWRSPGWRLVYRPPCSRHAFSGASCSQ